MENQTKEFEAVQELTKAYRALSLTPIVDDDYPEMRFNYDRAVEACVLAVIENRPTLVGGK